jgi:hypothetical protein
MALAPAAASLIVVALTAAFPLPVHAPLMCGRKVTDRYSTVKHRGAVRARLTAG